jgi:hypothetical protein
MGIKWSGRLKLDFESRLEVRLPYCLIAFGSALAIISFSDLRARRLRTAKD